MHCRFTYTIATQQLNVYVQMVGALALVNARMKSLSQDLQIERITAGLITRYYAYNNLHKSPRTH